MECNVAMGIKRIILEKGFIQKSIAEKSGFSDQQFCDMLNNRKIIRADYIPRIANAMGVTPNELYGIARQYAEEKPA